ncbi:hypothetical protein MAQ5080_02574 [Marinomonas aquimarina]|uniref:Cutinase n=1 Tax=Marinomonas aquimarina TaxID=295068 RepID=A0A1A8TJ21_9GAMM|nr:hypothetical protein [Marinomonas aquimarina]SBS33415.1 hypothetical protein MAQ5080_02574 [Marinomonas aquimarina]
MNALIHYLRGKTQFFALLAIVVAMYAPAKDLLSYANESVADAKIELATISFGGQTPWQGAAPEQGFVKASQSLSVPQQIFTKFTLKNPSNASVTYRKIWLYFEHESGNREYTTDYTLYDPATRQRLIGHSLELGPNSEIEVLASYRFIPSYKQSVPETVSISWESGNHFRDSSCQYRLSTDSLSQFGVTCE